MNGITELNKRLTEARAAVTESKNALAAAQAQLSSARDAFVNLNAPPAKASSTREFKAADSARVAVERAQSKLDKCREAEHGILAMLGGGNSGGRSGNGPISGESSGDGYAHIARSIDLESGRSRVDLPLGELLNSGPMASLTVSPSSGIKNPSIFEQGVEAMGRDFRHLAAYFNGEQVDPSILGVADWKQSGRSVSGTVERDQMAVTSKAKLSVTVTAEQTALKTLAIVLDKIPVKLIESQEGFTSFLQAELAYQLALALDAHCVAQILAATPPHGLEGATLIEQSRHAVAEMRGVGARPTVLALTPTEAAALDVQKTELAYIFATRDTGSASPLWNNAIAEVPTGLSSPLMIDPLLLAYLYLGVARFQVDPYTGLDTNEVRVRLEADCLLHVRQPLGAFRIAAE